MSAAAGAAGALIAVQSERKRREIIAYFEEKGALDPASAVALPAEPGLSRAMFEKMLRDGELLEVGAGTYWLDRDRAATRHARSKRQINSALTIISAAAAVAALAVLATR